ncbi:MAG: hypothetical protein HC945_04170 [Nitrosarchaeum sp.]|nr:hypothetical protein [Nitrosarchaeum sp.]
MKNRQIGALVVVAMLLSVTGTMLSVQRLSQLGGLAPEPPVVSGFATSNQTGNVSLTINGSISCTFGTYNIVDFGAGYVQSGQQCVLTSNGSTGAGCVGLVSPSENLILENDGNVNVTVSVYSSDDASTFLPGDASAQFQIAGINNETGSCANLAQTAFTDVNIAPPGDTLCSSRGFKFSPETADSLAIAVRLNFSQDVQTGAHQATLTAVCSDT